MSTVGSRVRELRKARGLSQQALAGDGISAGYISLIESGKRTPSPAVTEMLAERLGVPVGELADEPTTQPACDQARLDVNFARLSLANGDPAEAVRALGELRLDTVDTRTAFDAALVLAESLQQTGQLLRAVGVLESLVARCRRERSWMTLGLAATSLSVMYIESGDIARSVENGMETMRALEDAGLEGTDEHLRMGAVLAWALVERGDTLYASHVMEDLLEVGERIGSARAQGSLYWNAAVVANERGDVGEGLRLTERAVALISEHGESLELTQLRLNHAFLLVSGPDPQPIRALEVIELAEEDPALAGSRLDQGFAATYRGRALLQLGRLEDAAEQAARALQLLGPSEHLERAAALLLLGDVGTEQFNLELAHEAYGETELVLSQEQDSRKVGHLWRDLGDGWRSLGERARAIAAYDRSFRTIGFLPQPHRTDAGLRELGERHGGYLTAP